MRSAALFLLLPIAPGAPAQVAPAPTAPQSAPAPAEAAPGDLLAFTPLEERMTVPVNIAGAGPFDFIVDTGAQRTVVSRQLAGTLGLAGGRNVRLTAMTGTSSVSTVLIPSISVSTLGGREIEAPALEAGNLGALGILGIDSLQGHSLGIDFDRRVMTVSPARKRPRPPDEVAGEVIVRARSLFGQLVVTDAYIGTTRVRVVLDTGSPVSIGNEALRRRVGGRVRAGEPASLVSVTGETLVAPYGSVAQMKFGRVMIDRLPMVFADVRPFSNFGLADKPAMLLGMDALRLFRRVDIDFANREVRLLLPRDVRTVLGPG